MPSPIGHALGGLIVGLSMGAMGATGARGATGAVRSAGAAGAAGAIVDRSFLLLCAVCACLPDLDFLWGRHNMETHSLGFAVLVGLAGYAWQRSVRLGFACALACASHVLLDWLGSDTTPPLGVMALWPLTNDYYFSDARVFQAISRTYWLPNFVSFNLLAVAREIAILLPIVGAVWWWRARRLRG